MTKSIKHNETPNTPAELQNLLSKVVDVAPVALHQFCLKADGTASMPYASPDIEKIYGLTPAELAQDFSKVNALIHPDDRQGIKNAIEESARTLEPFHHEWRIRHPHKGEIWVECHSTPERRDDGSTVWYGYFHETTQRKQTEKDLKLWEFALSHLHESVFLVDNEARFLYVNDEACRSLGYSKEELLQLSISDIDPVFPLDQTNWSMFWDNVREAKSLNFETSHKHRDGSVFPVEVTANYFEYDQREYILALVRDISQRKQAEEDLNLLNFALNHVHEATYLIDENARFLYVNDEACRELGYNREELLRMGIVDIDPDYSLELWETHWREIKKRGSLTVETVHRRRDGDIFPVEVRANYFEYAGHGYDLAFVSDITERKQSEEHLALLSFALNRVHDAAYLIDEESRFLYVNDEACRQLGYSRDELLAMGVIHIDPDFPMEHWQEHWNDIKANDSVTLETSHQRKDGSLFPIEVSANYFEYNGQGYNLALVRDITERKEQEKRIEHLAYHDALTDLPNRTLTLDRLEHAIAQTQRHDQMLGVIFLDLDRFKAINDSLGHTAGDALLKQVGERLSQTLRREDTVGRVGGDEFLILLMELKSAHSAAHVSKKIHTALSTPFKVENQNLYISASIGISLYPRDTDQAQTLVQYADNALYLAKEEGRDTFRFFSPELDASIHNRLHMENDLRQAIDRDELLLHYQPLKDLKSDTVKGVEALVRWQHPEKGLIPPTEFIPVAEEIGLIAPIGEWVMHVASTRARTWQATGIPNTRVCVNLSQRQLIQSHFADKVCNILKETGCDPHLIEFEVTESSIMSQPETTITILQELHDMGIRLALDDFGTGYSSLAYLKRFPLDRLKIDKSFIAGIPHDINDMTITQTIIVLAHQLNLTVVAEGVETEAQRDFLVANDCDEMQGYLLSKPLPLEQLEELLGLDTGGD